MGPLSAKIGRPTSRTPAVETAVLLALAEGKTKREAASLAGIGYSTLREWELAFPEFAERTENAREKAKNDLIATIKAASVGTKRTPGQWQAAAWLLERTWPSEFARRDRLEVSMDITTEAQRLASELGLDEATVMAEVAAILASRK